MLYILRLTSFVAIVILASLAQGWTTPYPLKLGGAAAVIIGASLIALLWITRTRPIKTARGRESGLREILLGAVAAAVWFGAMHLYFQVAERTTGFAATALDRDREAVERDATLFENAGNFKEAADIILRALNEPHSPECVESFARRAVLDLAKASKTADRDTANDLLAQACEVANRVNVSGELPALALERLGESNALGELQRQVKSSEEAAKKAHAEHSRLEGELKAIQAKQVEEERNHKAEAEKHTHQIESFRRTLKNFAVMLISHSAAFSGDVIDGNLEATRRRLAQISRETNPEGELESELQAAMGNVEAAILATLPADLPLGTTSRIRRIDANIMPGLALVDIELFDGSGKPLSGLLSKDFVVIQNGTKLNAFSSPFSRSESLVGSVLFDTSSSTEGAPIAALKVAGPELISRLSPHASLRVASFSDRLHLLSDFTNDKAQAVAAVNGLRADGGTALYQSAFGEIRALSTKTGARVLIVFTDGANSLSGPRMEEVIQAALNAHVAIHFVALKGAGYSDTSEIERIASETGGKTFLVHEAAKLNEAFRSLSDSLQYTGYRLAVFGYDASAPMLISIGGARAVQLAVEPNPATPSLAQSQEN